MKYFVGILTALFLWLFIPPKLIFAQVVINEFSSKSNPEWVELFNTGSAEIFLSGWTLFLQDDPDSTQKFILGEGDTIPAGGFKVVERAYTRTQAWLKDTGDVIVLKDLTNEVNRIAYGDVSGAIVDSPDSDKSAGRTPDGSSNWVNGLSWTKAAPNPTPTPTPTLSPTATPTPTPTMTPTPTPTATKTFTPTKTSTPTVKKESTPTVEETQGEDVVLGLRNELQTGSPTPTLIAPSEKSKFPYGAIVLIVVGIALVGGSGFVLFKKIRQDNITQGQTNNDEQIR